VISLEPTGPAPMCADLRASQSFHALGRRFLERRNGAKALQHDNKPSQYVIYNNTN
jgi:hypothetical protein